MIRFGCIDVFNYSMGGYIMQNTQIMIDRKIVNYYEQGVRENPTIICLHGLIGNGFYSFGEIAPYLEKDFHLVIIDAPGHGETASFDIESDYLFSNLATWYHQIFQQIVEGSFYLMGHSWGADIALHYTKHYPFHVLGLILLDGGFIFPQNQPEMTFEHAYTGWDNYMNNSVYYNWEDIFREYQTYTKNWSDKNKLYVASLFKQKDHCLELIASKFTVLSIIKAFFNESFLETYAFIEVPILLIYSTIPQNLEVARTTGISMLQENIADVTINMMEDTNHMLQWDNPKGTAVQIIEWLNKKGT